MQAAELVLGQGLGGKEAKGTGAPVGDEGFQYGHIVGEGLADGGSSGQDTLQAVVGGIGGLDLVRVESVGVDVAQGRLQDRR
jgi:hypothetical protein